MKKTIYSLVVFGILIAGCSQSSNSNSSFSSSFESSNSNGSNSSIASTTSNFDGGSTSVAPSSSEDSPSNQFNGFSNLKIDLSSIKQIGIYKNSGSSVNGRKYNQNTNQNSSYLIGYNAEGDMVPLLYLNSEDNEIQVPYSVVSLEVVGDFSYVIYSSPQSNGQLLSFINNQANFQLGQSKFELAIKHSAQDEQIQFILLHNPSGKLFDMRQVMNLQRDFWGVQNDRVMWLFEEKITYFMRVGNPRNVCKTDLVFNDIEENLTKTEICTGVPFYPMFASKNGYFIYELAQQYYYASSDFSVVGDITELIVTGFPIVKEVGENIVLLSELNAKFVVFDSTFQILEELSLETINDFRFSHFTERVWLFDLDGFSYFGPLDTQASSANIWKINFENLEISRLMVPVSDTESNENIKLVFYENKIYVLSKKIIKIELDETFSTLEDNVYQFRNDSLNMMTTGYAEYFKVQGLSQINKYLNLQTGEVFLEGESRPSVTVTQVQPLN